MCVLGMYVCTYVHIYAVSVCMFVCDVEKQ